jgi:hypothetical protein
MRSIERRFEIYKQKNPNLGDFTILMRTVKGQKYSKDTMSRWFEKLVEKDDYSPSDKRHLMGELIKLTNYPEDNE